MLLNIPPVSGSPTGEPRVLRDPEAGLTLIAIIGLLAVISVGLAVFSTTMVRIWDWNNQENESKNLQMIANGIIIYLRQNKAMPPSLTTLSPEYVTMPSAQVTRNPRGFLRYFAVHPTLAGFQNSNGLPVGELVNARFLLLSDLTQDTNPTITTSTEFESWWNTDESSTPNLLFHRKNIGNLFYSLSITPKGAGGSFSIHNQSTHSNGGLLPMHGSFHLTGTQFGFDEDNIYSVPDLVYSLTTNTAYWFDPLCVVNKRWNPLVPPC